MQPTAIPTQKKRMPLMWENLVFNMASMPLDSKFWCGVAVGACLRMFYEWWLDPFRGFAPDCILSVYVNPRRPGVAACPRCAADRKFALMRRSELGFTCHACGKWIPFDLRKDALDNLPTTSARL
jgi:hypothetical protein